MHNWQRPSPLPADSSTEPMLQRVVMPAPGQGQHRAKRRRLNIHAPKLKPSLKTAGSLRVLHLEAPEVAATDSGAGKTEEVATRVRSKPLTEDGRSSAAESSLAQTEPSSDEDLHSCCAVSFSESYEYLAGRVASAPSADTRRRSSKGLPPPSTRAPAKAQDETWPLDDLFRAESGLSTISNGMCILCGKDTLQCPWGNPACRGCSFIDGSKLDQHPLRNIMLDRSQDINIGRPKATAAPHVRRCNSLVPPPFQSLSRECLRSHAGSSRMVSGQSAKIWPDRPVSQEFSSNAD